MFEFVTQHEWAVALALVLLLATSACAAHYRIHPGALNKTDSAAYDALLIAETVIDQARAALEAKELPEKAREPLNALIHSYSVARDAWLMYRGALAANVSVQE